jgi:hypothetical protein
MFKTTQKNLANQKKALQELESINQQTLVKLI